MDYIFYRLYKFYQKKKDDIPFFTSVLFINVVKLSILFLCLIVFNLITKGLASKENTDLNVTAFYIIFLSCMGLMFFIDLYRYYKIKNKLIIKYKNSKLNSIIKVWHIFVLPIIIVLLTVLIIMLVKGF